MFKKMSYVYTVYEEKSFSKAAERLFVSQPSLSAMVKKEESDYGITIFDRTTTPVSLTPDGEYYIRTARRIDISRSFVLYLRSFTLYNT